MGFKRKRFIHHIHRTLWVQRVMEYEQFTQLIEILSGKFKLFKADEQTFMEWVDVLVKDGVAPKVVAVILAPYQPTVLHALWNAHWSKKNKIDMTDPIQRMGVEQAAEVLLGFFVLNTQLIRRFLRSPIALALKTEISPMIQYLTQAPRPSSSPPAGTSPKSNG